MIILAEINDNTALQRLPLFGASQIFISAVVKILRRKQRVHGICAPVGICEFNRKILLCFFDRMNLSSEV